MLQKGYYSGKSENEILNDLGCEGCMPQRIVEPPGSRYDRHLCCDDIIMAVLEGNAVLQVGDEVYRLDAGDRIVINAEVPHSGVAGDAGLVYLMTMSEFYAD